MDATDLRVFETVAKLGVMSRAATELNTVQSNVTARIRGLEQSLGCRLFARHPNGVTLTDEGRRLLPYAQRIQRQLRAAALAVRDDGVPRGRLVIGSLESTAALRLAPLLTEYARGYPDVDLTLRTGTTCELIERVRDGTVDGAFVCGPVMDAVLKSEPFCREEMAIVAPAGVRTFNSLLARGDVRIVVLRAGCSYRHRLESILARHGIGPTRVLELGTIEAIFACVSAGLGITMFPRELAENARSGVRLSLLTPSRTEAVVETLFVRRCDAYVTSALTAFLERMSLQASSANGESERRPPRRRNR